MMWTCFAEGMLLSEALKPVEDRYFQVPRAEFPRVVAEGT